MEVRLSRKQLLGASAGVAAAAALGSRAPSVLGTSDASAFNFGGPPVLPPERIAIQLYTVRDKVESLGFAAVLETLAGIGYRGIEFAGYTQGTGAITFPQLRALLDANGLVGVGSHVSPSDDNIERLLDEAEILGLPHIGISFVVPANPTVAGWQQTADDFNRWGQAAAARGIKFYFHNHFQEFALTEQPPKRGIDILLEETDPRYLFLELDIYWAYVGQYQSGQAPYAFEPVDYVTTRRPRVPLFHVKDGKRNQASPLGYDIVDVGQGNIDFETFFCTVGEQNLHWYVNENDNGANHPEGSFGSAKASYVFMRHGLVGCGVPTAVAVVTFGATRARGRVTLTWRTAAENDVAGFHVWRSSGGRLARVNRTLVRARHAGRGRGASYRFVDGAPGGGSATYRLQLVHLNGALSWVGSTRCAEAPQ